MNETWAVKSWRNAKCPNTPKPRLFIVNNCSNITSIVIIQWLDATSYWNIGTNIWVVYILLENIKFQNFTPVVFQYDDTNIQAYCLIIFTGDHELNTW